ncbi:MAG TPA: DUF1697 domain-containing protein [Gemmatimonadaceae bacterium]
MQKYAAFIAGLPTGRNAISMDRLKALLSQLGFLNIETFLTSGNVIFETAPVGVIQPLEAQIARYLRKSLDVDDIWVFIRTPEELRAIAADVPFEEEDMNASGNLLFIVLLTEEPGEQSKRRLRIKRNDVDDLRLSGREIYWLRRPSSEAVAPPSLSEILEAPATVRSFHTIVRLIDRITARPRAESPVTEINPSAQSHP